MASALQREICRRFLRCAYVSKENQDATLEILRCSVILNRRRQSTLNTADMNVILQNVYSVSWDAVLAVHVASNEFLVDDLDENTACILLTAMMDGPNTMWSHALKLMRDNLIFDGNPRHSAFIVANTIRMIDRLPNSINVLNKVFDTLMTSSSGIKPTQQLAHAMINNCYSWVNGLHVFRGWTLWSPRSIPQKTIAALIKNCFAPTRWRVVLNLVQRCEDYNVGINASLYASVSWLFLAGRVPEPAHQKIRRLLCGKIQDGSAFLSEVDEVIFHATYENSDDSIEDKNDKLFIPDFQKTPTVPTCNRLRYEFAVLLSCCNFWEKGLSLIHSFFTNRGKAVKAYFCLSAMASLAPCWELAVSWFQRITQQHDSKMSYVHNALVRLTTIVLGRNPIIGMKMFDSLLKSDSINPRRFVDRQLWIDLLTVPSAMRFYEKAPQRVQLLDVNIFHAYINSNRAIRFYRTLPRVLLILFRSRMIGKKVFTLVMQLVRETYHGATTKEVLRRYPTHTGYPRLMDRWQFAFTVLNDVLRRSSIWMKKLPRDKPGRGRLIPHRLFVVCMALRAPYVSWMRGIFDWHMFQNNRIHHDPEYLLYVLAHSGQLNTALRFMHQLHSRGFAVKVKTFVFLISTSSLPNYALDSSIQDIECVKARIRFQNNEECIVLRNFMNMFRQADLMNCESYASSLEDTDFLDKSEINVNVSVTTLYKLTRREPIHCPEMIVLYCDDDVAVVYKPPNFPTLTHMIGYNSNDVSENVRLSDAAESTSGVLVANQQETVVCPDLASALLYQFPSVATIRGYGIQNRLDTDTSGLILVALKTHIHLGLMFQGLQSTARKKLYMCIALRVDPSKPLAWVGTIRTSFSQMRDRHNNMKMDGEREAVTHYKILERLNGDIYLLECELHTGRQHQIRVHVKELGMILLGDERYGMGIASTPLITRPALHARSVTYQHPNGGTFTVEATMPEDMAFAYKILKNGHHSEVRTP